MSDTSNFESQEIPPASIAIIQEIYDGENSYDAFESDLDQALESKVQTIIVEPTKLGENTAKWIAIGNCLHKTAVVTGFGSLLASSLFPDKWYAYTPFTVTTTLCSSLYALSWQFDPCCKYQVETNSKNLAKLPLHSLVSSSPIVLVRRDDSRRKLLHNILTTLAVTHVGWILYKAHSN